MAEVLCVYRQVKILKKAAARARTKPCDAVAIVSYDEKPGIQAIATTAPDLPPVPGAHATFARRPETCRLRLTRAPDGRKLRGAINKEDSYGPQVHRLP